VESHRPSQQERRSARNRRKTRKERWKIPENTSAKRK
jgi:hypothetical protein